MSHDVTQIAGTLSGHNVLDIAQIKKGGNSRIYKVLTDAGSYALKFYPPPTEKDPRARLEVEQNALTFLHEQDIPNVPKVIAVDQDIQALLLSWLDGEDMYEVRDSDIQSFASFLIDLARISDEATHRSPPLAEASEACISGTRLLSHIHKRLHMLNEQAANHDGLREFLSGPVHDFMGEGLAQTRQTYLDIGLDFDVDIPATSQVLIPSDYGAHNALRGRDGLQFLDFEYFGWDDPATSIVNFLFHPAMQLTAPQKQNFLALTYPYFKDRDVHFESRIKCLMPLYMMRWCMIVLGEFIPDVWRNRLSSGRYTQEQRDEVRAQQLNKAEHIVASTQEIIGLLEKEA